MIITTIVIIGVKYVKLKSTEGGSLTIWPDSSYHYLLYADRCVLSTFISTQTIIKHTQLYI